MKATASPSAARRSSPKILRKGLLRTLFGATVASSGCYMCSLKTTWELPKIKIMREWLLAEAAADRDFFDRYRAV